MITFQIGEWESVVILDKTDRRWNNKNKDIPELENSDFFQSRDVIDKASFVVYVENDTKKILKDRFSDGGEKYNLYVDAFLTNEKRKKNLRKIFLPSHSSLF